MPEFSSRGISGTSAEKILPRNPSTALTVKLTACLLALFASMTAFSFACRELADNFSIILNPLTPENIGWFIRFGVWALLFSLSFGVVSILVRPFWLTAGGCLLSAAIYGLIAGDGGTAVWIMAGVCGILLFAYALRVSQEMENQLIFSFRPLARLKLPLSFLLTLLVSAAIGLGYAKDAARRHYLIPDEIKAPIVTMLSDQLKNTIEKQQLSPQEKQLLWAAAAPKIREMADGLEKQIEPFAYALPYAAGALGFSFFQTALWLVEILSLLILRLLMKILLLTRFASLAGEMRQVAHLTLEPPNPPPPGPRK